MKRVAIYIRVGNRSNQTRKRAVPFAEDPKFQEEVLRLLIARRGWHLYRFYSDHIQAAVEHARGMPRMLADARRRRFDAILVWQLDHFTRNLANPSSTYQELRKLGMDFVSHSQNWDTTVGRGIEAVGVAVAGSQLKRFLAHEELLWKISRHVGALPSRENSLWARARIGVRPQ